MSRPRHPKYTDDAIAPIRRAVEKVCREHAKELRKAARRYDAMTPEERELWAAVVLRQTPGSR